MDGLDGERGEHRRLRTGRKALVVCVLPEGSHPSHWMFSFQIQTYDPEHWAWGRDRTLIP